MSPASTQMRPDAPGLEPYSKAWAEATCTAVPAPLLRAVVEISRAYFLDGRAPNDLAAIISEGLAAELEVTHVLHRGFRVRPYSVGIAKNADGLTTWLYRGRDDAGHHYAYSVDEIEATE